VGARARIGRGSVIGHDAIIDADRDVGENARISGATAATP
jgi:UDP-3-O-[3-hydroxymyristoyl] glucosamine N-acyltransferase